MARRDIATLEDEPTIMRAFASVRSDAEPEEWALISYTSANSVRLVATGEGGLAELSSYLTNDTASYALLRKSHVIDQSVTVKFVFLLWRPDGIPALRKAKLGIFEGQFKRLLSPYHVDMEASELSELSEDWLYHKIAAAAGTEINERRLSAGGTLGRVSAAPVSVSTDRRQSARGGGGLKFQDVAQLTRILEEIRDGTNSTNWCLFNYLGRDTIAFYCKGEGGVDDMMSHVESSAVNYGFFRMNDIIDGNVTTKFGFVVWQPEDVAPMKKALVSTHKGAVTAVFRPYHADFFVCQHSELNEEIASDRICSLSGSKSHVTTRRQSETRGTATTDRTRRGSIQMLVSREQEELNYVDESIVRGAIQAVRSDADPTDWVLIGYADANTIRLLGSGTGGVDELMDSVDPDGINYGLFRINEVIDSSVTVKFGFVVWQPETIAPTRKVRVSTHKGFISSLFRPYVVDFFVTKRDELNAEIAQEKLPRNAMFGKVRMDE